MCGIIGIAQRKDNVNLDVYDGLLMLQHRGQDAAGMVTYDGKHFHETRGNGLVTDVFNQKNLAPLKGNFGLGHVRYPTAGTTNPSEAQPFFVNAPFGIYLVHNGNLTNTEEQRTQILSNYQRHLKTESDTEVLLNVFADKMYQIFKSGETDKYKIVFEAVSELMKTIRGGYSIICLIDQVGLLAFRDPYGLRPLSIGHRSVAAGDDWAFASEDVSFTPISFKKLRDVKPGEAVLITTDGEKIEHQCQPGNLTPCIFEYIYLARPDSMIDDISVYKTRLRLGAALADKIMNANLEIDSIIPVPDSSRPMALELSKITGIKYREGLIKNRYIGRTFIMPDQRLREKSARKKYNIVPLEFRNRNILLVEDSVVRGTTMKRIAQMCRDAGAKKVYVASAAPPVKFPNVYGVDMPTRKELIAHNLSIPEIEQALGVDKIFYQTIEDTIAAAKEGNPDIKQFDCSCFDGKYITGDIDETYLTNLENSKRVLARSLPLIGL
jgi:amidophosphoribosyltransferase